MGSYINIGMVLDSNNINDFVIKVMKIIKKHCVISEIILKFPIDNNCKSWNEQKKSELELYEVLRQCCCNELTECIISCTTTDSQTIKGELMKVKQFHDNIGILFEIPEENFDLSNIDKLEDSILKILIASLDDGFDYAFCDNEVDIEYTKSEIINKGISYSILVINNNGKIHINYANWKIDGLTKR